MSTFLKLVRIHALVCALAALSLASCSGPETAPVDHEAGRDDAVADNHAVHWGYETDNGPDQWGSMNPAWSLCAEGRRQSPIDLADAMTGPQPAMEIQAASDDEVQTLNQEGVFSLLDNGHTIQINAKTGGALTAGAETYALVQFHFHAPSEHTVDGEHFPMEMHFVNQAEDGALAVVGVLVEEGAENPGLAPLWEQLAAVSGTEATVRIPAGFGQDVFSGEPTGVYHYDGSLTTPPCREGVTWFVRRTPIQLSSDQIAAFTALYDHNNRPVQPLNDRLLHRDENPTVAVD